VVTGCVVEVVVSDEVVAVRVVEVVVVGPTVTVVVAVVVFVVMAVTEDVVTLVVTSVLVEVVVNDEVAVNDETVRSSWVTVEVTVAVALVPDCPVSPPATEVWLTVCVTVWVIWVLPALLLLMLLLPPPNSTTASIEQNAMSSTDAKAMISWPDPMPRRPFETRHQFFLTFSLDNIRNFQTIAP
jgi:hypothetical protein